MIIQQVQNITDLNKELDELFERTGIGGQGISEHDARGLLVLILERITQLQIEVDWLAQR
jgi:hypothetical protein